MSMDVMPSLSFKNNRIVVVEEGSYENVSQNGGYIALREAFAELSDYDKIHFLDLDGIEYDRPQTEMIRRASTMKEIWADIGARTAEGITDAFIAGADKAILSTKTISSFQEVKRSVELSDELILCVDYDDGIVSPSEEIRKMGVKEFTRSSIDEGIYKVVFNDLSQRDFDEKGLRKMPLGEYELYIGGAPLEKIDYITHENLKEYILKFREAVRFQQN
ncbi:MAG: HisA/HisF-related TIM barrel protein [Thermoplasmata archaeon]